MALVDEIVECLQHGQIIDRWSLDWFDSLKVDGAPRFSSLGDVVARPKDHNDGMRFVKPIEPVEKIHGRMQRQNHLPGAISVQCSACRKPQIGRRVEGEWLTFPKRVDLLRCERPCDVLEVDILRSLTDEPYRSPAVLAGQDSSGREAELKSPEIGICLFWSA
jgi:hypothetical protein